MSSEAVGRRVRNPRGQGAQLREQILEAAAGLLDETGTEDAVTLRAVARRVGIAAPSIYGHFADRQAILLAVVERAFAELDDRLRGAAAAHPTAPRERLLAACQAYLDLAEARPQRYRVMFGGVWRAAEAVAEGTVSPEQVEALGQDALGVLSDALADCVAEGSSTSTDPRADAVALWVGLHGLAHQRAVSTEFPWPEDITERVVRPLARLAP